ncbi:hypothetical protein QYF36_006041 [Acer negundo]|nr:hypothetical protein QYF36_006041 [Acer negundo]
MIEDHLEDPVVITEDSNRDDNGGRRMNNKKGDSRIFREPKHEGSRGSKQGMSHKYDTNADSGPNGFKNSRRVIERLSDRQTD